MTTPTIRVQVRKKSVVRGKALVKFPGLVSVVPPILLDRSGGNFVFSLDMAVILAYLAPYFQPIENIDQEITSGASANVALNSNTVRVNKTVGSATALTLPPANTKVSAVLIADWKGDAGTNAITINPSGSEKIQGQNSWAIGVDGGSVFLRPIPGVGYVI